MAKGIDNPALDRTLPPREGESWFDGRESLDRPEGWPTIHQHRGEDGSVLGTWLLWPGDPVPDYPRKAVAVGEGPAAGKRGVRVPMLIGAGAGFLASGALYGLAGASSSAYHDEATSAQDLDKLRKATNSRYWASVGLAGASTVTTIGAFAIAEW